MDGLRDGPVGDVYWKKANWQLHRRCGKSYQLCEDGLFFFLRNSGGEVPHLFIAISKGLYMVKLYVG